jgi:hypothetical protein
MKSPRDEVQIFSCRASIAMVDTGYSVARLLDTELAILKTTF